MLFKKLFIFSILVFGIADVSVAEDNFPAFIGPYSTRIHPQDVIVVKDKDGEHFKKDAVELLNISNDNKVITQYLDGKEIRISAISKGEGGQILKIGVRDIKSGSQDMIEFDSAKGYEWRDYAGSIWSHVRYYHGDDKKVSLILQESIEDFTEELNKIQDAPAGFKVLGLAPEIFITNQNTRSSGSRANYVSLGGVPILIFDNHFHDHIYITQATLPGLNIQFADNRIECSTWDRVGNLGGNYCFVWGAKSIQIDPTIQNVQATYEAFVNPTKSTAETK